MTESTFSLVNARGRKYLTAVRTHPKPAVQALALTGCRVSEALAIRACDVDLEANELRIATLKRRRAHWRAVPVPEDLIRPRSRSPPETRAGEPQRREIAPLAHHPANREPPGGREHARRGHRGSQGVPAGPAPQLRGGAQRPGGRGRVCMTSRTASVAPRSSDRESG